MQKYNIILNTGNCKITIQDDNAEVIHNGKKYRMIYRPNNTIESGIDTEYKFIVNPINNNLTDSLLNENILSYILNTQIVILAIHKI